MTSNQKLICKKFFTWSAKYSDMILKLYDDFKLLLKIGIRTLTKIFELTCDIISISVFILRKNNSIQAVI